MVLALLMSYFKILQQLMFCRSRLSWALETRQKCVSQLLNFQISVYKTETLKMDTPGDRFLVTSE